MNTLPPDTCPVIRHLPYGSLSQTIITPAAAGRYPDDPWLRQLPRHIDLRAHLDYPHGSLSPDTHPEPKWRIEARQDAQECSSSMVWLLLAFIVLMAAIIAHHLPS